jgi:hypothetical protein
MARTHARLLCSIWQDQDFQALDSGAQRLYLYLLSQPRLSLVGLVDLTPRRWANAAPDLDESSIRRSFDALLDTRFVLCDEETQEVLIRTYVRHDGAHKSWQLTKAMWSAWGTIQSQFLRLSVLYELPDESWQWDQAPPPVERPTEPPPDAPCHTPSVEQREAPKRSTQLPEALSPIQKPSPTPTPAVARRGSHERDTTFETLAEVCGIDWARIPSSERGALNKACAELRPLSVAPEDIRQRAKNYRLHFENATLTPSALVRHWGKCEHPPQPKQRAAPPALEFLRSQRNGAALDVREVTP